MGEDEAKRNGLVTELTQFFALYVIYLFLSGWTFFDYYFREFQLDPRWLDLPAQEILIKGFTVLFSAGGYWLWAIYLLMILGPMIVDEYPAIHKRIPVRIAVTIILFGVLVGLYFASRSAGIAEANVDKGLDTRLPVITFFRKADVGSTATDRVQYAGNVLAFRNGVYYLHNVRDLNRQSERTIALCVMRLEDLTDVQITEH
jgi:hypothetical protein